MNDDWRGWKNGKYDNRYRGVRRHSGKKNYWKAVAVIIGIVIIGFVVYQNFDKITNKVQTEIPKISGLPYAKPIFNKITSFAKNVSKSVPTTNIGLPTTTVQEYTSDQLRQIVLDDVNNYRIQNGVNPVVMDNAKASQSWADHLLSEGCIVHREGNEGPMQRYVDNRDNLQWVFENISGGYGSSYMPPPDAIKDANHGMMFDDADQGNRHRDNILNPNHISISVGIAYNSRQMVIVEDFQEPFGTSNYDSSQWKQFDMSYSDSKACW